MLLIASKRLDVISKTLWCNGFNFGPYGRVELLKLCKLKTGTPKLTCGMNGRKLLVLVSQN